MNKKRLLLLSSGVILAIALGYRLFRQNESREFPDRRAEFEIQGLTWRTIAYYYYPGIYKDIYNPKDDLRLIAKARKAGANYLLVRAFYNVSKSGELIGDEQEAKMRLKEAITTAHDNSIKIFLTPFIESMEFWPQRKWELSKEDWTKVVLE